MGNVFSITDWDLDLTIDHLFVGCEYQRGGRQMRMSELSEEFFELLLEIQKYQADLIANDIYVLEAFGIVRSERRGDTTRSQAMNVSQDSIDWMNC